MKHLFLFLLMASCNEQPPPASAPATEELKIYMGEEPDDPFFFEERDSLGGNED